MAVAVTGDPAAMRSEAYGLRAQAEALASLAQQLQARIEGLTFEGPAADRFRAAMIERYHEALRLAGELQDLADYVFRAAARVEAQIAELQRQEALRRQRELELQEYGVTRIVLDPTELAGAASELRGTAGEYTSLGTQAASCNCHCMPADVAATVDAATASIRASRASSPSASLPRETSSPGAPGCRRTAPRRPRSALRRAPSSARRTVA